MKQWSYLLSAWPAHAVDTLISWAKRVQQCFTGADCARFLIAQVSISRFEKTSLVTSVCRSGCTANDVLPRVNRWWKRVVTSHNDQEKVEEKSSSAATPQHSFSKERRHTSFLRRLNALIELSLSIPHLHLHMIKCSWFSAWSCDLLEPFTGCCTLMYYPGALKQYNKPWM